MGCHSSLQGLFVTQGSNPGLLHCRRTLYWLSHQGRERERLQGGTEEPREGAEIQGKSGGRETQALEVWAKASPASPSSQAPVLRVLRASSLRGFKQMAAGKFRGPGEAGRGDKGGREHSCRGVLIFFFWGKFRR